MIRHSDRRHGRWLAAVCCLMLSGALASAADPDPLDWPHWRGPEQNGISREKNLISSWDPEGENIVWKNMTVGTRSTPICLRGKIYTITRKDPETTKEAERVVCIDAQTGEILWENVYNVYLTDAPAERVGWASVVGDPKTGNIYALGICGYLQCIDGETGKTIWSRSMNEEYGLISTYGGRTNFPILFEDLLIISGVMTGWGEYAIPAHRFVAFDKRNGVAVWLTSTKLRPMDTTYSTPILTYANGQALIVAGSGDGSVYALQPRTGKKVWSFDASLRGINTTATVHDGVVYMGHSEENSSDNSIMGAIFALDAGGAGDLTNTPAVKWLKYRYMIGRAAPLFVEDRVYFTDDGATLFAIDPETGKELGKQKLGRVMFGSPIYADGKIYVNEQNGQCWILKPTPKGAEVINRVRLDGDIINASPIVSHGRVYITTEFGMYCLGDKTQEPSADPIPSVKHEAPLADDMTPAQILAVPVEVLLKPGFKQNYQVRVFNKQGQFLKVAAPAELKFTLDGPGTIDDKGQFTAPPGPGHAATMVTVEMGELKTVSRIRTVPPLPWRFDFSDKKVPITWVGCAYRHQPRDVDGESMIVKITTIPKGTRSQGWFGPVDMHDYTIAADLRGAIKDDKMPIMGLINQRYALELVGATQQLQVRSWAARMELRFAKVVPFEWKPDVWYRMKFQSETQPGKVVLRGKVWPRGEDEPAEWTIEAADETPNLTGSPGLFGNATDAEIFIDNVEVTPNQAAVPQARYERNDPAVR